MEENEREQKTKQLEVQYISQLNSGNIKVILDTLKNIRDKGKISILPEVINMMLIVDDPEILQASAALLNDLKEKEAKQYIIDALKNDKYKSIHALLLAACWQNGMDYHEHTLLFTDLFIKSEYATALEAFTVIEENIAQCDNNTILLAIDKLVKHNEMMTSEKEALQDSLIEIIKNI